ncbi:hypothetical protein C8R43DRAFT_1127339 [Mycena crocata]|nr:hypothetical protein C8R43DRAFT_1127339 [Mycena crocata]
MTPDETKTLRTIGLGMVRDFVAITNETVLLTIYGVLVLKAGLVLLCDGRWRKRSALLTMIGILVMFAISVILWVLDMVIFIQEAKLILIIVDDLPLKTRFSMALSFVFRVAAAENALYSYMSLMGDAIIIWRVWNFKAYYRPWVVIIPVGLLLGSIVATLMLTYCVAAIGSEIVVGTFQKPAFCRNVQTATYAMSCATTTAATILIGITTWNFRQAIKPMLNHKIVTSGGTQRRRRSQVESILLLLVESGVLYFLFFAVEVAGVVPRVHDWVVTQPGVAFVFAMYSYSSSVIVGIYPTIVVVLAYSHRGVLDEAASTVGPTSTLRLAQPTGRGSSGTWPTLQLGNKRTDNVNEIELDTGRRSSSRDLDREQTESIKLGPAS